jgi:hypothetical protein
MKEYLTNIKLTNNKNALSSTIKDFTKNSKYAHPKYWAPFLPIGKRWGSYEKKEQRFQTISRTSFGNKNFKDMFLDSIKYNDHVYAIAASGTFVNEKFKDDEQGTAYLVKYDLKGNLISKHLLTMLWEDGGILGRYNNLIILAGSESTSESGGSLQVGVFNIENNTFEIISDKITLDEDITSNSVKALSSGLIDQENLYVVATSFSKLEDDTQEFSRHHLIKYNFKNKSSQVHSLPTNKENYYWDLYTSVALNIDGKINIFIPSLRTKVINPEDDPENVWEGMFTEHYILENEKFVLNKVYKNIQIQGYLPEVKMLYGHAFENIDNDKYESKEDPLMIYKINNSDIAFFSFKKNKIKLHHSLEIPKNQMVRDIIKMGDKYLILGNTLTKLKWSFNNEDGTDIKDPVKGAQPFELGMQEYTSTDPVLILYDKSFNYVDSVVYPDRILSIFSSIEKIDDDHYMLFELNKGSRASVTINKL